MIIQVDVLLRRNGCLQVFLAHHFLLILGYGLSEEYNIPYLCGQLVSYLSAIDLLSRQTGYYICAESGTSVFGPDLVDERAHRDQREQYVICAGAVLTLGILHQSGFGTDKLPPDDPKYLPAMGRFMTEQTLSFCQVILKDDLVQDNNTEDPLLFPLNDPDPRVCVRFSKNHPWHMQIHRDAFGYGEIPPNIDQRVVVDLRSFGYTEPNQNNCVTFDTNTNDGFGMPQPTFHFEMSNEDKEGCDKMFLDMVNIARHLGGFLPGAEPRYLPMGAALHICGTTYLRLGPGWRYPEDSVVDKTGKVHGITNLVLGGCGVIPTGNACNSTLTAAALALAAADQLNRDLTEDPDEQTTPGESESRQLFEAGMRVLKVLEDKGDLQLGEWVMRLNSIAAKQRDIFRTIADMDSWNLYQQTSTIRWR
ncbi:hypothetical protein B0T16DRAFT_452087 [Cercophora newfieldiana]|uniref:Glucose-methanol-choline oxidoreductase C-terminal domain-containing protein n=1 Tax=Cercophora newfieldiana TaxID=92897 RepID=A0AA40CZS3_9PEZI|nr:hypothetical protein B0T16DRAFT_452087 [Cercophora newfieldiana]